MKSMILQSTRSCTGGVDNVGEDWQEVGGVVTLSLYAHSSTATCGVRIPFLP